MKIKKIVFIMIFFFVTGLFISSCGRNSAINPEVRDVTDAVFGSGFITYSDEYWVTANAQGFILNSYIKEGDKVTKEQSLFELSSEVQALQSSNARVNYQDALINANPASPQILQLKNQIAYAEKTAELDRKNYNRYSRLIKTGAVSQLEFEKAKLQFENTASNLEVLIKTLADLENKLQLQVKNAKNKMDIQDQYFGDYLITSVLDGIVLEISKNTGEQANKGEMLARIGAGKLVTKLYISEEDINLIKLNQEVDLSLNTDIKRTYKAKVSKIYPAFDDKEQSFVIEVDFTQDVPKLYSGTQVQANIIIEKRKNALIIPSTYLFDNNKVLLKNGDKIEIKTGIKNSEWVEVVSGIDEHTTIISPR
jgi:multidrug efflux pump subunit AcrA (membrane-fusion protein)